MMRRSSARPTWRAWPGRVSILLLAWWAATTAAARGDEDPRRFALDGHRAVTLVDTVSFRCTESVRTPHETTSNRLSFQAAGACFRADFAGGDGGSFECAFDGRSYQQFALDTRVLKLSPGPDVGNPTIGLNPLLVPYLWLCSAEDVVTMPLVRESGRWEARFAAAVPLGQETIRGRRCVGWKLVGTVPETTSHVWFRTDPHPLPERWRLVHDDGRVVGQVDVLEWRECPSDGESACVPVRIEAWIDVAERPGAPSERDSVLLVVDPGSLEVNEPVDRDAFTISPTRARWIYDHDPVGDDRADPGADPSGAARAARAWGPGPAWSVAAFFVMAAGLFRRRCRRGPGRAPAEGVGP